MAKKTIEILTCDGCGVELKDPKTGVSLTGTCSGSHGSHFDVGGVRLVGGNQRPMSVLTSEEQKHKEITFCKRCFLGRLPSDWREYQDREERYRSGSFGNSGGGGASGRPLPGPSGLIVAPLRRGASW
jgi:hypothetical protein